MTVFGDSESGSWDWQCWISADRGRLWRTGKLSSEHDCYSMLETSFDTLIIPSVCILNAEEHNCPLSVDFENFYNQNTIEISKETHFSNKL